jgi:hypothetical protein
MKKKALLTGGGILGTLLSVYLFYLYINGLNDGGNILLFLGSLICSGISIFGFILATKPPAQPVEATAAVTSEEEAASRLQQNNEMVNDYNKTAKAREKLRMMQLADSVQKK